VKVRIAIVLGLLFAIAPILQPRVVAQLQSVADDRFAGLQWRFVRIKYHYVTENSAVQQDFYGEPWLIDGPAAEQNLSRRVKTATAIQGPLVLVFGNLQQAVLAAPSLTTSCGPAATNPGLVFHAVDDRLDPGETTVVPVLILKIGLLPVTGTPSVLSGLPLR